MVSMTAFFAAHRYLNKIWLWSNSGYMNYKTYIIFCTGYSSDAWVGEYWTGKNKRDQKANTAISSLGFIHFWTQPCALYLSTVWKKTLDCWWFDSIVTQQQHHTALSNVSTCRNFHCAILIILMCLMCT